MTCNTPVADEILNAYIDGELDTSLRLEITEAMLQDAALRKRVEELRIIRDLVKLSYNKNDCDHTLSNRRWKKFKKRLPAAAALLLVCTGSILTTLWLTGNRTIYDMATTVDNVKTGKSNARNVMVHVTTADSYRWNIIISELEKSLLSAESRGESFQLRLVTNAQGMGLVSGDPHNPFSKRLQRLISQHPNFAVQVCKQTIKRIENKTGRQFHVFKGAQIIPSALGEVIDKRKQGWVYLKL